MSTTDDRYWELAGALLHELGDRPLQVCSHVRSSAVLHACAGHPAAGLACAACATTHLQRHHVDPGCVLCGADAATSALHRTWPVLTLLLTGRDGAELSWTGTVDGLLGRTCATTARAAVPEEVRTTAAPPPCTTPARGPHRPGR